MRLLLKRILSIVFVVAVIFTMATPVFAQGGSEAKSGVNFPAGDTLTIIVPVFSIKKWTGRTRPLHIIRLTNGLS